MDKQIYFKSNRQIIVIRDAGAETRNKPKVNRNSKKNLLRFRMIHH